MFWRASESCESLTPAFYRFDHVPNIGLVVKRTSISTDNLIELPDSAVEAVVNEFDEFWTLKPRFLERGFIHKRGYLLWGPPGSGKTSGLMLMSRNLIAAGGIVVAIENPEMAADGLRMIRAIEPDRPIVALMEDLDALINEHGENRYLALLDGETQVANIVFVATTNYPEKLDKRFVDRPSRFDTIRFIGMPTSAARRTYLSAKEPGLEADELARWVAATDGFSVAHLRELIILVKCFGKPLHEAIKRLEKMRVRKPSSEEAPDRPAFGIQGTLAAPGTAWS
jgi:SpoVK/Ycf46/Vps4 family AAA+-type ATPase